MVRSTFQKTNLNFVILVVLEMNPFDLRFARGSPVALRGAQARDSVETAEA